HVALKGRPRDMLWTLPAIFLLFALSIARVGNVMHGAWFAAAILVAFGAAAACGRVLLPMIAATGACAGLSLRLALRQISPRRRASRTAFVALTMTALLLGLPPQLRALLRQQLLPPGKENTPSLFLFDIQPDEVEPLHAHLLDAHTDWQRIAPMVRARLVAINDETVATDDGAAGDASPQRSGLRDSLASRRYNLTFQSTLHSTEKLVAGSAFDGDWNADSGRVPEISLEREF